MGLLYDESIHQVVELCCELIGLAQNAYSLESEGKSTILAYTLISECASRIKMTAEKCRWALAETQWQTYKANVP